MATNAVATSSIDATRGRFWILTPWLSRLMIGPPILIMVMISARYTFDPVHGASQSGVILSTPEAMTDTRVIGALAFTLALVVGWTLISERRLRIGHAILIAFMGLVLIVRTYGFLSDGTTLATGDQRIKGFGEFLFLTMNSIGFAIQTRHMKRSTDSANADR